MHQTNLLHSKKIKGLYAFSRSYKEDSEKKDYFFLKKKKSRIPRIEVPKNKRI